MHVSKLAAMDVAASVRDSPSRSPSGSPTIKQLWRESRLARREALQSGEDPSRTAGTPVRDPMRRHHEVTRDQTKPKKEMLKSLAVEDADHRQNGTARAPCQISGTTHMCKAEGKTTRTKRLKRTNTGRRRRIKTRRMKRTGKTVSVPSPQSSRHPRTAGIHKTKAARRRETPQAKNAPDKMVPMPTHHGRRTKRCGGKG